MTTPINLTVTDEERSIIVEALRAYRPNGKRSDKGDDLARERGIARELADRLHRSY